MIEFDGDERDSDIEEILLGARIDEESSTQLDIAFQELQETAKDVKIEMDDVLTGKRKV